MPRFIDIADGRSYIVLGSTWTTPAPKIARKPRRGLRPRPAGLSSHVLTVGEVMARLDCGRSIVFRLLAAGDIDRADLPGKETLVTVASVERYERGQGIVAARTKPRKVEDPTDVVEELRAQRQRLLGKRRPK